MLTEPSISFDITILVEIVLIERTLTIVILVQVTLRNVNDIKYVRDPLPRNTLLNRTPSLLGRPGIS